ncbi:MULTISPECIES: response regulator transcription factor [Neobacillus]|uniref:Response regulator n=1 Tax=Neobacillus rhizophilus TaxID=2833579 RepID=A0A942U4L7_9BACI|nr:MULTISPECIES: response regulator [Neobacillus]MBS4212328.1 response regulator [Neobacillus rhizophilus]
MYTILLVDDEKWVRTALRHTIAKAELPFEVIGECTNGLEALDFLKEKPADLVMTDVRMAVMDGLAFVTALANGESRTDCIMISGYDDFKYVQHALRSGVFDYLLKPVELEELKECLDKWVKHRQESEEAAAAPQKEADPSELSTVEKVIQYVKSKVPGEVTLSEAANYVHLNPSYLSKLFKDKTEQNFVDFVLEIRMNEAKKLLERTSLRISEIADRLGYSDITYFSNLFKRKTGVTPSEYRKRVQTS